MTNKPKGKTSSSVDASSSSDGAATTWNVLVYMAADNNLKEESVYNLNEMLEAHKASESLNVAAQLSASNRTANLKPRSVKSDFKVTAQLDSGDAVRLFDFNDAKKKATAKRAEEGLEAVGAEVVSNPQILQRLSDSEMLRQFLEQRLVKDKLNLVVLSGHGSGAVGDFMTTNTPPSALSIPDIRSVLTSVRRKVDRKIDVLGMDSCLMSMAEVGYELRETVDYLVGSEGFSRNAGWPYRQILSKLKDEQAIEPKDCARMIVREYMHFYAPYTLAGVSVDQAACDLTKIGELREPMTVLSDTLCEKLKKEATEPEENREVEKAVILAHWKAQSYKLEQYVDLWDFCDLLSKFCKDKQVVSACSKVKEAICGESGDADDRAVLLSCYSGAAFQYSKGLSIYFPWAKSDLDRNLRFYEELAFSRDTHWGEFLALYGAQTQRKFNTSALHKSGTPVEVPMLVEAEIGSVRSNLLENTRSNLLENTRSNLLENTRFGQIMIPMVKNPPDSFLKYEDDCAINAS